MSFLAPLMLAGAGLLAAPFLIHRIRRPEREPIRFSSLLFIPDVKKEVIERRRLQHILLMLTRMAILLLLAFAFARPFAKAAVIAPASEALSRHVILVDTSFSMAADNGLGKALDAARGILRDLRTGDEVAVLTFAESVEVLAPFASDANPDAGTVSAARTALGAVAIREEGTDYASALREAQRLLLGESNAEGDDTRRVVHLVSDLQRTGMPGPSEVWKLSPAIELSAVPIEVRAPANFAISDVLARRTLQKDIRVVGKVKNWSGADADVVAVTLMVDGAAVETVEKPIRAGNATQFSFTIPVPESGRVAGYLELGSDAVPQDNRRYFVWSPPTRHDVAVIPDATSAQRNPADPSTWASSWYVERGLPSGGEWPFNVTASAVSALRSGVRPSAAIVSGTQGLERSDFEAIRAFVTEGGAALVLLDTASEAARAFAASLGLEVRGMRFETVSDARYELLTWISLNHPIFAGFQGHLYNDFSALRFHQYVELANPPEDAAQVLARFESGAPAMVEIAVGEGTVMVWPFAANLRTGNLPKSTRFVPLLYETMQHLCRVEESDSEWRVGDVLRGADLAFDTTGRSRVQVPGGEERVVAEGEAIRLTRAGVVTTRPADGSGEPRSQAVNVNAEESDPGVMEAAEFELRLASSPRLFDAARRDTPQDREQASVAQEYGILLMAAVVALLVFESWYMSRLTARRRADRSQEQ